MTLVIVVGTGIRDETGCTNVCFCTVIRPDEVAAMACIWSNTQAVAAPMPRTGSVWLDRVCLVPNPTSVWMVAWMRLESIWRSTDNRPGSGPGRWGRCEPVPSVAAPAAVECETNGTAAAATAEAD